MSKAKSTSTPKPGSPSDYKSKRQTSGILTLPSGAVVQAKNRGGMRSFLTGGLIPNSLMPVIMESLSSGQAMDVEAALIKDGELDLKIVDDMMGMIDAITVECWVMPPVLPVPLTEDDRDPELLYVDEVLDDDKMFVFNWVAGGTQDLERFRKEQASAMDDLAQFEDLGNSTK